ncbi:MAG: methyltransferase domain-containing protein, partial [Ignavibacteriae bacterium]|nr:methyltransferase domain-containing protein [Ignavibacteriota bacterium]
VRCALGIDIRVPENGTSIPFVCGHLPFLPMRPASVDLLTLRFVVEHLEDIARDFSEVERVLRPGGHVVILTTNSESPLILFPRLLPFALKNWILRTMYKVDESDIFPTFHRFNSIRVMKRGIGRLRLERFYAIQDANFVRRWIFVPFLAWHVLTRPKPLQVLRTNILSVFVKHS